ncbi:MAG TPA: hypothetical protein VFK47_21125 [Ktedonobacteraceae bacterium]|nr:hypothetical protein [Ktedonobacteraceae bacterium]
MKGWRTILWGLAMAVLPVGLHYLGGVDWTQYLSPTWAPVFAGIVTMALRLITTTPVGTKK